MGDYLRLAAWDNRVYDVWPVKPGPKRANLLEWESPISEDTGGR
jgi:hypothetical protein